MGKALFVTGTGTDVGKTYVTGLLVKKLHAAGLSAGYFKSAMSGNVRDENGRLIPGDAKWVKEVSGIEQSLEQTCPYVYETAVSPHLASRIEKNPVQMDVIERTYQKVLLKYDYVTVEGSGGILCPIAFDNHKIWLEDLVKKFEWDSVIVANAGLGTINSVVLTCEYMKKKQMPVRGIIFNNWTGGVMEEDNIKMCEYMTEIPVIAKVSKGDQEINIAIDTLTNLYK